MRTTLPSKPDTVLNSSLRKVCREFERGLPLCSTLLPTEPCRHGRPIKSQIATDADTRQRVKTTAAGLLINPSFRDLQTLCEFSYRQNLRWVNREWTL